MRPDWISTVRRELRMGPSDWPSAPLGTKTLERRRRRGSVARMTNSGTGRDLIDEAIVTVRIGSRSKDDAVYEPERVLEHEMLHLGVMATSPVGPGEERPADLHLAARGVVCVKP